MLKYTQSESLFPTQDVDRPRPPRIQGHCLPPSQRFGLVGKIVKQCIATLAIPTQSLLQLLVLLGKKNGGSRTIAILRTTYRLTMRLIAGGILRPHVARAAGIELTTLSVNM